MALYTNPYSGDDTASDPAAQRRRAILDMMAPGAARTTQGDGLPSGLMPPQTTTPTTVLTPTPGVPDYAPNGRPNLAGRLGWGDPNKQTSPEWMAQYGNTPLDGSFAANNPALANPLPNTLREVGVTPSASSAGSPAPGATRATNADGGDGLTPPSPASGGTTPSTPGFTSTDDGRHYGNQILDLYDDPYTRRNTYGGSDPRRQAIASALVSSGNPYAMAAGAVGYLDAYLHRHADSAPTDFSVDDATQIIRQAYREMHGGQEISDQELNDALTGQGLRSGSHWVGQAGLEGVLGHLAENAAATGGMNPTAAAATTGAGGTTAAGGTGAAGTAGAAPGGPLATNPNTGVNGGASTSVSGPSGSTGGGGAVPANIEGVDAGKWNDPNKHDPKYDVLHMIASAGSLDAAWPQIQQAFPGATRVSQDVVDFGGDIGKVDLQRDSENNGGYHWEPVDSGADQSAAGAAPAGVTPSPVTTPGAAQLAAPLTNNAVLQQIMDEVRRIQSGQPPRNAILQQMGVA